MPSTIVTVTHTSIPVARPFSIALPTAPWRYRWSSTRAYAIGSTSTPPAAVKPTCAMSPASRIAATESRS
jgi:hypothetical protein